MITVKSTVTTKQLERLLDKVANPQPLLEEVGKSLQSSTRQRIRDTKVSPNGAAFAPWSFATARARERDGTAGGGILYRSGRLHDAIQYQVNDRQVTVGVDSTAPYAKFLQSGTPRMPARPFIGFSEQDLMMIRRVLKAHLKPV